MGLLWYHSSSAQDNQLMSLISQVTGDKGFFLSYVPNLLLSLHLLNPGQGRSLQHHHHHCQCLCLHLLHPLAPQSNCSDQFWGVSEKEREDDINTLRGDTLHCFGGKAEHWLQRWQRDMSQTSVHPEHQDLLLTKCMGTSQTPSLVTNASVQILGNKWQDEEQPWCQQVWRSFH